MLLIVGCSGESGPPVIFPIPYPTDLRISGVIDLADVAVHQNLGGITPSLIDLRPFALSIQDHQNHISRRGRAHRFWTISIRESAVIICRPNHTPTVS